MYLLVINDEISEYKLLKQTNIQKSQGGETITSLEIQ